MLPFTPKFPEFILCPGSGVTSFVESFESLEFSVHESWTILSFCSRREDFLGAFSLMDLSSTLLELAARTFLLLLAYKEGLAPFLLLAPVGRL